MNETKKGKKPLKLGFRKKSEQPSTNIFGRDQLEQNSETPEIWGPMGQKNIPTGKSSGPF